MTDIAEYRPIAEVLGGIELLKLPEGAVPLAAMVFVKYLSTDGREEWCRRQTNGISLIERVGAMHANLVLDEDDVRVSYRDIDAGDDFEEET